MADAQLVADIDSCAKQFGASAAWMLATAMQESGGQYHPTPGDNGTSFGPFQHHVKGACGARNAAQCRPWAESKAGVCERARAFAAANVNSAEGAYRVQRPAARLHATYVANVKRNYPEAVRLLRTQTGSRTGEGGNRPSQGPGFENPISGITDIAGAVTWIFHPDNMLRVLMVLGGVGLIALGVVIVVKSQATGIAAAAVKGATS